MSKIIEFFKTLFMPRKMVKYRSMTVFIAILIFILSTNILLFPIDKTIKRNFEKYVDENNYLSLQAITEMPENDPEINKVISEIKNLGLSISNEDFTLEASNMKFTKLTADNSLLGVLELSDDNYWVFNGEKSTVYNSQTTNENPYIIIDEGKIKVNNIDLCDTDKTGEVELIKITCGKNGYFVINNNPTQIPFRSSEGKVSINEDNYIVIDGFNSNVKVSKENVVILFTKEDNVEFYSNVIKYNASNGKERIITFVVDNSEKGDIYNPVEKFTYSEELFPDIYSKEYYLILINFNCFIFQAHPFGVNDLKIEENEHLISEASNYSYFTSCNFNSETFTSTELAKDSIIAIVKAGYIARYNSLFTLFAFVYSVIFPLFFAFIFWLFFRKTGRLKTIREYINIAALSSIPVVLITFIVLFFYPDGLGNIYPMAFALYYLVVLYRINSSPEAI